MKKQQWFLLAIMLAIPILLNIVGLYRDRRDLFTEAVTTGEIVRLWYREWIHEFLTTPIYGLAWSRTVMDWSPRLVFPSISVLMLYTLWYAQISQYLGSLGVTVIRPHMVVR